MLAIKKLLKIIAYLRSKDGCAWDKKQTHESLLPHLEEETWEVMDAVKKKLYKKELKEELADVLLQVIMHSPQNLRILFFLLKKSLKSSSQATPFCSL